MEYLLDCLDELEALMGEKHLLLLLDFDGTLAHIALRPAEASLSEKMRLALEKLVADPNCTVVVVSGRAIPDLAGRVGVPGITYVGNHGLEISRPGGGSLVFAVPEFGALARRLVEELTAALAGYQGTLVEDKGCSLAVHYRLVGRRNRRRVRAVVRRVVRAHGGAREIEMRTGKMVVELRPPLGLDKGVVVTTLIEGEKRRRGDDQVFALYLGDDMLDEGAFEAVADSGLGVLVGRRNVTYAQYRLNDPDDVHVFLTALGEMRVGVG